MVVFLDSHCSSIAAVWVGERAAYSAKDGKSKQSEGAKQKLNMKSMILTISRGRVFACHVSPTRRTRL